MDIVRPDAIATAVKPAVSEAAEAVKGGKSFDQVLNQVDGSRLKVHDPEVGVPSLQKGNDIRTEKLTADKTRVAKEPGGIEKLSADVEHNTVRMREIVNDLQSGRTFTPQELLGIQAEMNDITLQIEVTTKVVAEAVSGVKNLMQQQG
jgi:hypothetical protein